MSLGQPSIRLSDLNDNSTRWDRMRAAPSDDKLHQMWIGWSTAFFLSSMFNLIVFMAIALSKRARKSPFNKYLLALMFPDLIYTGFCAIQCAYLAGAGGFTHPAACKFQSVYIIFGVAGNSWLSGVIGYEIYQLLKHSYERKRYFPPTTTRVVLVTSACYTWSLLLGTMTFWGDVFPHEIDSANGLVCLPITYDVKSELFFWLFFFPMMNGFPMAYAIYVAITIYRRNMLPSSGKTRDLTITFFRIVGCFIIVWIPSITLVFATPAVVDIWVIYAAGVWAHLQGGLSAIVLLLKSDFKAAFIDFLRCRTFKSNREYSARTSRRQTVTWLAPNIFRNSSSNAPGIKIKIPSGISDDNVSSEYCEDVDDDCEHSLPHVTMMNDDNHRLEDKITSSIVAIDPSIKDEGHQEDEERAGSSGDYEPKECRTDSSSGSDKHFIT